MTITSTPSEVSYAGDGVTVAFPIPFVFDTAADLKVASTDSDGNVTTLTTGFSVSGGNGSTGTLTFGAAPASTVDITILDNPEIKQATDYVSNDPFPAESHERALDRLTRICKRLTRQFARSLHTQDGDPISDLTLGSVDNRKGKYLFFNALTGAIEYAANVVTTTLSQSIIGQLLFPQTPAESAAGVLPTNYAKQALPIIDAARHGFAEGRTEAQNASSIAQAVSVLLQTSAGGGIIQLPPGKFDVDPFLVPANVWVRGTGQQATWLTNGDSGPFITLGTASNTGVLKYGCGLSDLSIFCNHRNGNAIYLRECAGFRLSNIYAENNARTGNTDTCACVTIDGGDVSTFFNVLNLVIANHWHYGFRILSSGSVIPTQTTFLQCSAFGDVASDNGSIGLDVVASIGGDGQQSAWHGGNIEACAIGVKHGAQSGPLMFFGLRTEANTVDVQFGLTCSAQAYIACLLDSAKIVDNSGAGFERHTFFACHTAPGAQFGNKIPGATLLRAAASAAEIPLKIQGFPGQTADLIQLLTSAGAIKYSANVDGSVLVGGKTTYTGVISPTQITANQNDYAPTDFAVVTAMRVRSDASRNITGLAGGAAGREIRIFNVGTQDIVLTHEDAASAAANRFNIGASTTLQGNEGITLWYDGVDSRWRSAGKCV